MKGVFPIDKFRNIETPFYYYDTSLLRKTLDKIKQETSLYSNYHVHYAVKANANNRILSIIRETGFGADCVSGGEIKAALEAGFPAHKIVFAGVGKADWEIKLGLESDIYCFNVESVPELDNIDALAASYGKTASIALRINPNIDAHTHHYIMFFTNKGRAYRLKAYEIPEAGRTARGTAIINLLQLMPGECITAVIPLRKFEDGHYLMMATKNGLVKKTPIKEYANVRKNGLAAITLRDDDELIEVKLTDDKKDIILVTKDGMCIRFKETDVRSTGRTSMGVRGMNIDDGDEVVAMQLNSQGDCLLIVSANGMGKRTSMGEFTCQNRGGKGVKCYKITEKTGDVIGARAVNEDNEVMLITTEGIIIRIACADISILGRITSGVKLINLTEGVTVASVAKVRDKEEKDTNAQQAAVEITDSAETEESDQPTDQETQDENRGEEE